MENTNYHDNLNNVNTLKLRQLQNSLPSFCKDFFLGIKDTTSTRTRLAYAYDLRIFFEYLKENNPTLSNMNVRDFKINILEDVTASDIIEYMDHVSYYEKDDEVFTNEERGKQ